MIAEGEERTSLKNSRRRQSSQLGRPQKRVQEKKKRDPVLLFYWMFSIAWIFMLGLAGALLWRYGIVDEAQQQFGALPALLLVCLIFVPLLAIWGPYIFIKRRLDEFFGQQDDQVQKELFNINKSIADLTKAQNHLAQNALGIDLATPKSVSQSSKVDRREKIGETEANLPHLALGEQAIAEEDITLNDIAHVLNFSDRKERGDWANAFARIREQGQYVGFVRTAERLLEIFESEGIYVEDLSLRPATPEIWRRFLDGERGGSIMTMAGVQDPSVIALVRARLRNDNAVQEISLRYQKNFLEIVESLADDASDEDFLVLNRSRGGRLFAILGNISGTFGKVKVRS